MLLIGLSAASLLFGWIGQTQWLIVVSVAASVLAALFLTLAYDRSKTDPLGRRRR
jgi:membrane protein implicated in regulation of membrane protease activity